MFSIITILNFLLSLYVAFSPNISQNTSHSFYLPTWQLAVNKNAPVPKTSNDVDKDLKNAIILLKQGNTRRAKKYLNAILNADSEHDDAKSLLKQIKTSAKKYFGKKHFKYRVQKGDSLSSIAKKYLKDPLKFYALARYNRIKNPSKLKLGMLIKIPGEPPGLNQISKPADLKNITVNKKSSRVKKLNYQPDEDLAKAVSLLKSGRRTSAKAVIKRILLKEPKNIIAKKLLNQIVKPPYSYFGKAYFFYRVQKGQDFAKLARKFLNDSVKFYALARYNDIIPNNLKKGDVIRIPGIMPQRDYNRIVKAISLLKSGRRTQAKKELHIVQWYYPKNKSVISLLEQIEKVPEEYFGQQHFSHRVRPGESFSTLSEKYLNDPLKFYALARYNKITVPKHLRPGIKIKIPGEHPDKKGSPSPEYQLAKKYSDKKRHKDAYLLLEKLRIETKHRKLHERENSLLVHAYTQHASQLFGQKMLKGAFELMERAADIDIKNEVVKSEFSRLNDLLFAERHFIEGKQQMTEKDRVAAYLSFQEALKFNPKHKAALKQAQSLKPNIVDKLYKQGIVAFRRQELEEAITAWDQVLTIEPGHDLAKRNMERALDLKKKAELLPAANN